MSEGPITLNFGSTEAAENVSFEPLEPGAYPATIASFEIRTSASSGQPYFNVTLQLTDSNRREWYVMSLQPSMIGRAKRDLISWGINPEAMKDMDDPDDIADFVEMLNDELNDTEVELTVGNPRVSTNGKSYTNITRVELAH